jgi:plasmid maintenance system antidote protein VapI
MKLLKHKTEDEQRNELLKFMDKNNFSANFLSKEIGCHPQTITNWVNGEKSMRLDTLEMIHKFIEDINN